MSNMACTYVCVLWLFLTFVSTFFMPTANSSGDPNIASIVKQATILAHSGGNPDIARDVRDVSHRRTRSSQIETMASQLKAIEQEITKLSLKIGQTGAYAAFQVSLNYHKSGWKHGKLIFDSVDYNLGGGYNRTSGYFTAPVSGNYIIWANAVIIKRDVYINIYKNWQRIVMARGYAFERKYVTGSATVVIHLDIGDTIHFWISRSDCHIYGFKSSHYGGALIT